MMAFLGGGFFILMGLAFFFARDFTWEVDTFGKRMQGYAVERNDLWEFGANVRGVVLIVAGVVLILIGFAMSRQNAYVNSQSPHLENTFGNAIVEWRKTVSSGEREAVYQAEHEGVEHVVYGGCGYSDFAVIISGYQEQDYMYTNANSISDCNLDGTWFWMSEDLGDGWYRGNTIAAG